MKEYLEVKIDRWFGKEQDYSHRADLTENFFIYLENYPDISVIPIKRLDGPAVVKYEKVRQSNGNQFRVDESFFEHLYMLDIVFEAVVDALNQRDNTAKCFYVKYVKWSNVFHPTAWKQNENL